MGGPSLRRRPAYVPYPGDRGMDGEVGWGPSNHEEKHVMSTVLCINRGLTVNQGNVWVRIQSKTLTCKEKPL